jgi:hypothetical protein
VAIFSLRGGDKGWAKTFGLGQEQDYCDEIKRLNDLGYRVEGMPQFANLAAAVIEGNPDLVPLEAHSPSA